MFKVCRDVFDNPTELSEHEQLHKYPGGFACAICEETFSNETDRVHHTENVHKVRSISFFICFRYLRLTILQFRPILQFRLRLSNVYAAKTNYLFPPKHCISSTATENITAKVDMQFAYSAVPVSKKEAIYGTIDTPTFTISNSNC